MYIKNKNKSAAIWLVVCVIIALVCMFVANLLQTDFGKVNVVTASFEVTEGQSKPYTITYKIYIPEEARETNKLPALLCLHGYQNDHETCAAYAIELARRGAVVLCIDEYGHGKTQVGLVELALGIIQGHLKSLFLL